MMNASVVWIWLALVQSDGAAGSGSEMTEVRETDALAVLSPGIDRLSSPAAADMREPSRKTGSAHAESSSAGSLRPSPLALSGLFAAPPDVAGPGSEILELWEPLSIFPPTDVEPKEWRLEPLDFAPPCFYGQVSQPDIVLFFEAAIRCLLMPLDLAMEGVLALRGSSKPGEDEGSGSLISSILGEIRTAPGATPSFFALLAERERRFFENFGRSHLNNFEFDDSYQELDMPLLLREQKKVLFDAVTRSFTARYNLAKAQERFRDEGLDFSQYRAMDYVILAPLMAAFYYGRGIEKKIQIGDHALLLQIEGYPSIERKRKDGGEMPGAAMAGWQTPLLGLTLAVSAGLHESNFDVDFVGIATDFGIIRKALDVARGAAEAGSD